MRDFERAAQVGFEQESKERRAKNRQSSAAILDAHGIAYETNNGGVHLVIKLDDRAIDFWPGTGTFTDRKMNRTGRGVHNLLKKIASLRAKSESRSDQR